MLASLSCTVDFGAIEANDGDGEDELHEAKNGIDDVVASEGRVRRGELESHSAAWRGVLDCPNGSAGADPGPKVAKVGVWLCLSAVGFEPIDVLEFNIDVDVGRNGATILVLY